MKPNQLKSEHAVGVQMYVYIHRQSQALPVLLFVRHEKKTPNTYT